MFAAEEECTEAMVFSFFGALLTYLDRRLVWRTFCLLPVLALLEVLPVSLGYFTIPAFVAPCPAVSFTVSVTTSSTPFGTSATFLTYSSLFWSLGF